MNSKTVFAGLALAGALAAAAPAHAGGNVQWSVTIGAPLPAVVVRDTYYPYHRPPVVVAPRYVGHWDRDRDGIPDRHDRTYNPRWDRDGDGIANRHDRHPDGRRGHGRGDRDGDGVPNRHDRHPDGRHGHGWADRDHDGVPNRYDRHDRNPHRD